MTLALLLYPGAVLAQRTSRAFVGPAWIIEWDHRGPYLPRAP